MFLLCFIYTYYKNFDVLSFSFFILTLTLFLVTTIKSQILLPLNKLWMQLGLFLGLMVNPIILGLIFFGLITPVSIIMKLFRRDELNLTIIEKNSYWKDRISKFKKNSFKNQF